MKADGSDQFYQLFLNMAQVNSFNGTLGFGFRQLNETEMNTYCSGVPYSVTEPPLVDYLTFNESIGIRIMTSGCYYMDMDSGVWRTDGVEVIEEGTNTTHTHCRSTHLTEFAGGLIVLPPPIDLDYGFANASFEKNALIYLTVIGVLCLYIALAIWAFYMDRLDKLKTGICALTDNDPYLALESSYFYEFIVLTGTRNGAGTDSKVRFIKSLSFQLARKSSYFEFPRYLSSFPEKMAKLTPDHSPARTRKERF